MKVLLNFRSLAFCSGACAMVAMFCLSKVTPGSLEHLSYEELGTIRGGCENLIETEDCMNTDKCLQPGGDTWRVYSGESDAWFEPGTLFEDNSLDFEESNRVCYADYVYTPDCNGMYSHTDFTAYARDAIAGTFCTE